MATYRFGSCVFEPARRQLTRDGKEIDLSPRALKVLTLLLQRHPDAVSKTELYQELWPDTFVELTNLNNVVAELRAAIGDREKRVLKTKHRFGYVFAGPIALQGDRAPFVLLIGPNSFSLREGDNVVGRTEDAVVSINSPEISRRHALIRVTGDHVTIEDLGSKNGTSVNGRAAVGRQELPDGATACFGSICGTFHALRGGASTLTSPGALSSE